MVTRSFSARLLLSSALLRSLVIFISLAIAASAWAATPTTTTLAVLPGSSVPERTVLTLTATVTAGGSSVPAGLVKFCDMQTATFCEDSALLGSVWVTRAGAATLRLPLSFGTHKIQAVFQGTSAYSSSQSTATSVAVATGSVTSSTKITSVQSYGYGGMYQVRSTVTGAPIPALSGTLSFLDTSNANYSLMSVTLGSSSVGFTPLGSVGGTSILQPQYTAVGDFNGDGKLDFVVASNFGNIAQVFLGNGDGTFTQSTTLATDSPSAVLAADFNGDGKLDIAILNLDTIAIYLGNGDGSFTLKSSPSTGDWGYGFTVADFNGDGIPDFAVTENYMNVVQLLLGNGDGTFQLGASFPTGNNPEDVVAADFNRDGRIDLAFVNQLDYSASILLGDGRGNFTVGPTISLSDSPYTLAVGDFNGDGIPDLGISALTQGATIFLGAGDGSFTAVSTVTCGSSANGYGMAVTDFNNDGVSDLVVGGTLFLGDGTGHFTVFYYVGGNGSPVSLGDFNGDGSPDLITPVYSNNPPYSGNVFISLEQATVTTNVAPLRVLGPGTHNVLASYAGDALHAPSQSATVALTGAQIATTLMFNVFPGTSVTLGDTVQLVASLPPQPVGNYTPTGSVTFYDGATVLGTVSLSGTQAIYSTNALTSGSHSIKAVYAGDTNFVGSTSTILVVTVGGKPTPVITWSNPSPITYGTALSATQLNATTTVPGTFTYSPAAGTVPLAGPRILSVTFTPTDTTTYNSATTTVQLLVNKATLTATVANAGMIYGGPLPSFDATYTGFVNGDTQAALSGSPSFSTTASSASPVGSYAITATQGTLNAANYAFTFVNGTLMIGKATLTVTANNATKVYGSANPAFTANYSGFVNGDTQAVLTGSPSLSTAATSASSVGNYAITAAQGTLATTNYSFAFANGTFSITAATLTVGANNASMTYGGPVPTFSANYSGFVNGDTQSVLTGSPSLTTTATSASPVGNYTITAAQGSLSAANYSFTFVNSTLFINKATITVTATNASSTYGAAIPAFSATYSGFLNGDTQAVLSGSPSLATTATSGSPAGTYTIVAAQGTLTAGNYSFAFVNGVLMINKATLTVTANNAARIYGSANPTFTASYLGFVNGDTQAVLTGAPSLTTSATSASPVGTYTIVAAQGTLAAANYSFTFVNGTLSVNKATLTVSANNNIATYGGPLPVLTANYSGFVSGDTQAVLSGSPSLTTAATQTSTPGTYAIVAAQGTLSATNYAFAYVNGALTITKAGSTTSINVTSQPQGSHFVITVTITVAPQYTGTPTGSITLSGNPPDCTGVLLLSAGTATCTYKGAGAYNFQAQYSGDANFNSSTGSAGGTVALALPRVR